MKEVFAEDAIEGQMYMFVLGPENVIKMKVITINKASTKRGEVVTSVTVDDERYPGNFSRISGGTKFLEYDEEFYTQAKALKLKEKAAQKVLQAKEESKSIVKKEKEVVVKIPRSRVIDTELAKCAVENAAPNWEVIALKVLKDTGALESDKSSIVAQAKARYKWYTVDGKVNPQLEVVK